MDQNTLECWGLNSLARRKLNTTTTVGYLAWWEVMSLHIGRITTVWLMTSDERQIIRGALEAMEDWGPTSQDNGHV